MKAVKLVFVVLGLMLGNMATMGQEVPPPPVTPPFEGAVLENPKAGISVTVAEGEIIPMAVSSSRGYGDAVFWLSPITDYIAGEGITWLGTSSQGTHTICARVVSFTNASGMRDQVVNSLAVVVNQLLTVLFNTPHVGQGLNC